MKPQIQNLVAQNTRGAITHHELYRAIASLVTPATVQSDLSCLSQDMLEKFHEYMLSYDTNLGSISHYKPTFQQVDAIKNYLNTKEPVGTR